MAPIKRIYMDIDPQLHQAAKVHALTKGITLKDYVRDLIAADLGSKSTKTKEVKHGTRKKAKATKRSKTRKAKR